MRFQTAAYILISLAIGFLLWTALGFDFYQDDAYITYRYAANYLNGDGLVFNIGERVEGYTNFGWLVYLLLCGVLGLNFVVVSKLTGVLLGAAVVFVAYLIAEKCLPEKNRWLRLLPVALVASNLSFAYWAQAGLETAAFVLLASLALYLFLLRHRLLIAVLTFAVLIRPEGALLAGLFILIELIVYRQKPWYSFCCALIAFLFSLPLVAFKLFYYGSILPNSFHAKTGFDLAQLQAGWEYSWRFFGHYPHYGVALIALLIFWKRVSPHVRAVWLFAVCYSLYVLAVGGDVLKVHRFFLPTILPLAIIVAVVVSKLAAEFKQQWLRHVIFGIVSVGLILLSVTLPRAFIDEYALREKALTEKMGFLAKRLQATDSTNFTAAASTIGNFSYQLMGHRVIDMLGLTDSTIARHPEPNLPGMTTSWRERSFNSSYLLKAAPDYILFSTGMKPSAPAERSLLTYPQFLDCYRGISFYYRPFGIESSNPMLPVFRKQREPVAPFRSTYPIEFVNQFTRGINAFSAGRYVDADSCFQQAFDLGGEPPYVYLLYQMAMTSFQLGREQRGEELQNQILEIDSAVAIVQADLYTYEFTVGNTEKAAIHRRWLEILSPWKIRRYDSLATIRAARYQQMGN